MANICVKIKDPSGSHYIASLGVKVNKSTPYKGDNNEQIAGAISSGILLEITEKEYNLIVKGTDTANDENQKAKAKAIENPAKALTDMLNEAIDRKIIEKKGDQYKFGNKNMGSTLEEMAERLIKNGPALTKIQDAVVAAKTAEKTASDTDDEGKKGTEGGGTDDDAPVE